MPNCRNFAALALLVWAGFLPRAQAGQLGPLDGHFPDSCGLFVVDSHETLMGFAYAEDSGQVLSLNVSGLPKKFIRSSDVLVNNKVATEAPKLKDHWRIQFEAADHQLANLSGVVTKYCAPGHVYGDEDDCSVMHSKSKGILELKSKPGVKAESLSVVVYNGCQ